MSIWGKLFPSATNALSSKTYEPALLRIRGGKPKTAVETAIAQAATSIENVLKMRPYDVQILGALAMADRKIVEMQTGEGKTLTAVMAAFAMVQAFGAVHVLTANDYLATRDAAWMGPVYEQLGLKVASLTQKMEPAERRNAYAADVLYATANEVGFDYLRDGLVLHPSERVCRTFHSCLIDEADSILIDEARIPLVIAGGAAPMAGMVQKLAELAPQLRMNFHFTLDEFRRNVLLTADGAAAIELAIGCPNLYAHEHHRTLEAAVNAIQAQVLLRRDVDYLVRDSAVELVDEFKGRVAQNRRWPAALQTAIEAKEAVPLQKQGRILGQITLQSLMGLYPVKCGMTGTAATQADELRKVYKLEVVVIPTNKPMIRVDQPDVRFRNKLAKEQAITEEIVRAQAVGRPVLVGTASVAESERLSAMVGARGVPHVVLNARQDEHEAQIVAAAGQRGAVTISTNMAGRGTDIQLWPGVAELGGLYVIGANRHEARRIDNQLRGRAGRQGDPGESRFLVSFEDDLMQRYRLGADHDMEHLQRVVEGQNLAARTILWKYEGLTEYHRQQFREWRDSVLEGDEEPARRQLTLEKIDEAWSEYLGQVTGLREGIHWVSYAGRDPLNEYLHQVTDYFERMPDWVENEVDRRLADPDKHEEPLCDRGSTWVYLVNDQPWGTLSERAFRGLMRLAGVKGYAIKL